MVLSVIDFGSNHRGRYKKHGKWAYPVFPSNIALLGSVPTPYIFDDRAEPFDIAEAIDDLYQVKQNILNYIKNNVMLLMNGLYQMNQCNQQDGCVKM